MVFGYILTMQFNSSVLDGLGAKSPDLMAIYDTYLECWECIGDLRSKPSSAMQLTAGQSANGLYRKKEILWGSSGERDSCLCFCVFLTFLAPFFPSLLLIIFHLGGNCLPYVAQEPSGLETFWVCLLFFAIKKGSRIKLLMNQSAPSLGKAWGCLGERHVLQHAEDSH